MATTGRHAPWRLWILVIFWFLQLAILTFELIVRAIAIHANNPPNTHSYIVSGAILCTIAAIFILITVYEIVLLSQHRLRPAFYTSTNAAKTIFWLGITVSGVVSAVRLDDTSFNAITVIILIVLFFFFLLPMIYGIVETVKERKLASKGSYNGVQHNRGPSQDQRPDLELQGQQTGYHNTTMYT